MNVLDFGGIDFLFSEEEKKLYFKMERERKREREGRGIERERVKGRR